MKFSYCSSSRERNPGLSKAKGPESIILVAMYLYIGYAVKKKVR